MATRSQPTRKLRRIPVVIWSLKISHDYPSIDVRIDYEHDWRELESRTDVKKPTALRHDADTPSSTRFFPTTRAERAGPKGADNGVPNR